MLKNEMGMILNETNSVEEKLTLFMANYSLAANEMTGTMSKMKGDMRRNQNRTSLIEIGLAGLMNFSLELDGTLKVVQDNVTNCVHGLNDMNVSYQDVSQKVLKLYELNAYLSKKIVETAAHLKGNSSKLTMTANMIETELNDLTSNYNGLQIALAGQMKSIGEVESQIQFLNDGNSVSRTEIESLKFEVAGLKAESSGMGVFVGSMQSHISSLTSNMTVIIKNMTHVMGDVDDTKSDVDKIVTSLTLLASNVSHVTNAILDSETKIDIVSSNLTTIKINLVGLGDYINSVNGDVGQLLFSFSEYTKTMKTEMSTVLSNITKLADDMTDSRLASVEMKKHLDSVEFVTTTIRSDVAGITTKIYNLKTSIFEQSNELSTLKAMQSHMQSALDKTEMRITDELEEDKSVQSHVEDMKSDIFAIRTGLASLTNTVFTIKSQVEVRNSMDSIISDLKSNVSHVRSEFSHFTKDFYNVKPGKLLFQKDYPAQNSLLFKQII